MLSFVSNKSSSKPPVLFEIRIDKNNSSTPSGNNDVLIFKGPPEEAPSILLTGNIVLSITEPMHIKSMYLKLTGDVRIKVPLTFHTQKGEPITRLSRFDKRFYEHTWGNKNFKDHLSKMNTSSTNSANISSVNSSNNLQASNQFQSIDKPSSHENANVARPDTLSKQKKAKSTTNLKRFASSFSSTALNGSTTSLSTINKPHHDPKGSATSSAGSSHLLPKGNYEFPFSLVLPGNTTESVEGMPHACCVYKLQAVIERGRYLSDLQVKKHIRIIRTHAADSLDLSETVAVDNCWPKKVEYTISTPAKAVIIGSSIPIHMAFVPLAKGLKLGTIKCYLLENSAIVSVHGDPYQQERIIAKSKTPNPLKTNRDANYFQHSDYQYYLNESEQQAEAAGSGRDDQGEFQDKWEVTLFLDTPTSLSKCTQDCTILTYMRVRHKLKFVISLINSDGHVSELRASLPIQLFISPFVPISCKSVDPLDTASRTSSAPTSDAEDEGYNGNGVSKRHNQSNNTQGEPGDDTVLFDSSTNLLYDSVVNAINSKSSENLAGSQSTQDQQSLPALLHSKSSPQITTPLTRANGSRHGSNASGLNMMSTTPINSTADLLAYSRQHSSMVLTNLLAPPNYEHRVYDKLWDGVKYIESGQTTPKGKTPLKSNGTANQTSGNNGNFAEQNSSALDLGALQNGLQRLQLERADSRQGNSTPPALGTNFPPALSNDYFSKMSLTNVPTVSHLSRTTSFHASEPQTLSGVSADEASNIKKWKNVGSLAKVPSYKDTMKSATAGSQIDLPPVYDPQDYEKQPAVLGDDFLKRPKQSRVRGGSNENMPTLGLSALRRNNSSGLSMYRTNSANSTDNISDNNDSGIVIGQMSKPNFITGKVNNNESTESNGHPTHQRTPSGSSMFRKNKTVTKKFGFGMTPMHQHQHQSQSSLPAMNQGTPPPTQQPHNPLGLKNKSRSFSNFFAAE
ncbi:hypothetical protein ACO0RG_004646 [Hanseniaspora osmophila]|uniref:Protein ROD1 n=1 Tax=Hanseniaspora osmophila TaxID=56408 RepID=A0A1E5S051_9ASCO|nr:Protein ROD1 [Hanseniaspora osmophila]